MVVVVTVGWLLVTREWLVLVYLVMPFMFT